MSEKAGLQAQYQPVPQDPNQPPPGSYGQPPPTYATQPQGYPPQGYPPQPQPYPGQGQPQQPYLQPQQVMVVQQPVDRSQETAATVSMVAAYVVSCLVLWLCNCIFGLIGFILAVIGSVQVGNRKFESAKKLNIASIVVSIIGVVVTVILIIVFVVWYVNMDQPCKTHNLCLP